MKSPVELNSLLSIFFFVISLGCYISWLDATLGDLQTRPLRQILLFLRNSTLTVWKLQTESGGKLTSRKTYIFAFSAWLAKYKDL